MASSSTPSSRPEREPANTSQEMETSSSSSSRSLFSCCFDCVSAFLSRSSVISHPMASSSTTGCFNEIAPSASTSGVSASKPVFDVFINHRGPDVKKTLATRIYKILEEMEVKAFLDSKELEYGDFLPATLEAKRNGFRGIKAVPAGREELWPDTEELTPNIRGEILSLAPNLVGLKFLVIGGDYSNQITSEVSRELLWFRLSHFSQSNLAAQFSLKNLRVLQLFTGYRLEELWKVDSEAPAQLRELEISWCDNFQRFPNSIGCLNELRKMVIRDSSLESLPEEFCNLRLLEHLDLRRCRWLSSLPSRFGDLTNLQYLNLKKCVMLQSVPDSCKKLTQLQYLNLWGCIALILRPDDFQNITKLDVLDLTSCSQLKELPCDITNQVSLRKLYLLGLNSLRELKIGHLSRLQKIRIGGRSLISLPFSVGCLNLLEELWINNCPISHVDFEAAPLSSASSNLKKMTLTDTEVCRISISEHHYPHLENLKIHSNCQLTEIEALPAKLEELHIRCCPKLEKLPSFERLTSLRAFEFEGCDRIGKIEGLEGCTSLEILSLRTSWEVPGIESLERMGKLRKVELRANKGSAIERCIGTIENWPDEMIFFAGTVPDASSVVDSFKLGLSTSLCVVGSSNKETLKIPALRSLSNSAIMLCYIINAAASSSLRLEKIDSEASYSLEIGREGRWALICVFAQLSDWLDEEADGDWLDEEADDEEADGDWVDEETCGDWLDEDADGTGFRLSSVRGKVDVERGLAVTGEKKMLAEALLQPLQSIWS